MAIVSTLDQPYQPGDCHAWTEEISSNSKTVVPYPLDRTARVADELAPEGGEEGPVDVVYATDVPSHRQGVQVFHGGQEGHSAQTFWSRCRIQICTSQAVVWVGLGSRHQRLLFRVGTNMALQMLESCKEALAMSVLWSASASMGI